VWRGRGHVADNTVIWQNYHTTLTDAVIKRRLETTHLKTKPHVSSHVQQAHISKLQQII
jgi:hypothetical protein